LLGVKCHFWLPTENIADLERRHQQPYRTWAGMGLITLTPGNVVDYAFVRAQINGFAGDYDLRKLLIDPYNAAKLAIELTEQDGLPVEALRQGFLSLSDPTKQLLRLILGQRLRHAGNPILRWHAANAVAEGDAAGNIKLSKKKSRKKIDGMAALVNAVAAYTAGSPDDGPSVYEKRGLLFL
jgi:phage terminase large subunit-like protein